MQHQFSGGNSLRFKSPYSVLTEPKTTKSSKSWAGGSNPHGGRHAQKTHYSPPLVFSGRHVAYPTIHEMSGSYENFPQSNATTTTTRNHFNPTISEVGSKKYGYAMRKNAGHYESRQSVANSHTSYSQRASRPYFYNNNNNINNTSEYGSADPSPTNPYPSGNNGLAATTSSTNPNDEHSFENTDYDTDSDAMTSTFVERNKVSEIRKTL